MPYDDENNYFEKSGNENTVAKATNNGIEWTSHLLNDTFEERLFFLTLNSTSGEFITSRQLKIPNNADIGKMRITTKDDNFLIFIPSRNYSTATILDAFSGNYFAYPLFPNPFFASDDHVLEKGGVSTAYTITDMKTQMPFETEVSDLVR